jgi:hypothetical protein
MLEFFAQHRGPIETLVVLAFACSVPFAVMAAIRRQRAHVAVTQPAEPPVLQHRLVAAVNEAGAIGVGIVWTVLIYKGPSLTQLWLGAGHVSRWTTVLAYTMFWLSLSRAMVPDSASVKPAIIARVVVYGMFLLLAVVGLNDW